MSQPNSALPRNALINALAGFWQLAVMYLLVPLLIAHAGASHYGLWVLLSTLSVAGVFAFLDLGVIGSVVKWVADYVARRDFASAAAVLNLSLMLFLALGCVAAGLLVAARPLLVGVAFDIPVADRAVANWMILGFALQLLADLLMLPLAAVAQALMRFDWLRSVECIKLTLFAVGAIACLRAGYGVQSVPFVGAGLSLLALPIMAWLAHRELPAWRPRLCRDRALLRRVVGFSAKVFTLRLTGSVYRNMDKLILGAWLGTVAVKDYDVVFKVHFIAMMPIFFVTPLLVPFASGLEARGDREGLRRFFLDGSRYLGALCLPVAAGVFLLAEPLLTYWLGPGEAGNATLVRLLLLYLFFWPLIQVGWNGLVARDRLVPVIVLSVLSVGANLALSLLLIGPLGIAGVIAATIAVNALAFGFHLRLQLRCFGASLAEFSARVLPATAMSTALGALTLYTLLRLRHPASLIETLLGLAVCVATAWGVFWAIGMDPSERAHLAGSLFAGRVGRASGPVAPEGR